MHSHRTSPSPGHHECRASQTCAGSQERVAVAPRGEPNARHTSTQRLNHRHATSQSSHRMLGDCASRKRVKAHSNRKSLAVDSIITARTGSPLQSRTAECRRVVPFSHSDRSSTAATICTKYNQNIEPGQHVLSKHGPRSRWHWTKIGTPASRHKHLLHPSRNSQYYLLTSCARYQST